MPSDLSDQTYLQAKRSFIWVSVYPEWEESGRLGRERLPNGMRPAARAAQGETRAELAHQDLKK